MSNENAAAAAEENQEIKTEEAKTEEVKVESESKAPDILAMSDEEFMKLGVPNVPKKEKEEEKKEEEKPEETAADSDSKKEPEKEPEKTAEVKVSDSSSGSEPEKKSKTDDQAKGDKGKEPETKPVNYEDFFKQVMTPFKANGKVVEVKTPEEAIRLMQMGAGYGRKIQDLQPHLKVIRMLEKNDLLDTNKLSFLIDINQKNPEAIKKLIKDAGVDPLDLNPDDKVVYVPPNHAVSDKEMAFQTALGDIQQHPSGNETLRIINQTWDQQSKGLLWESPELFDIIQTQRDNGVYDQIAAEIDRQKTVGTIPPSTPFLQAYKAAGDHLVKTNGFKQVQPVQTQAGNITQPETVIATRAAVPKTQVSNNDKAAAAASTKTSSVPKVALTRNPLEMSDDEFMKLANANR